VGAGSAVELHALIDYLAGLAEPPEADRPVGWGAWQITRIGGGRNNQVYRATTGEIDVAVKLTSPGFIDRAGHEYGALQALVQAGLAIAPPPLLLDQEHYPMPVVVSGWLKGAVGEDMPPDDEGWERLVEHFLAIHAIRPEATSIQLERQILFMRDSAEAIGCVRRCYEPIPQEDRPASLVKLAERLEAYSFPSWPQPAIRLCRGDPNIANMVRRPGRWASVDWEYSGWGDPASEIAGLLVHPAYLDAPAERLDWLLERYAAQSPDAGIAARIRVYRAILECFWVARFARMIYQMPRGHDVRLAPWPDGWLETIQGRYELYVERAWRVLP
jgi:aminoglycoside phosphotransferase (APT) family kinase protein